MTENDKEYHDFQKAIRTLEHRDFKVNLKGAKIKIVGIDKSIGTHGTGSAIDYLMKKYDAQYFG